MILVQIFRNGVLALCISLIASGVIAQRSPNIIFIYADDLGYGELGSYGQQKIKTPYLDQLAAAGIRFTQHYAGAPVCAPSRCMLLTGKHSGHAAIRGNFELGGFADSTERGQMPLPAGTFTVAQLLKQAGYATAIIGKWGLGMHNTAGNPNNHGFDVAYGYLDQKQAHNYYPTHLWDNGKKDTLDNADISVHRPIDSATATDSAFAYYQQKIYAPDKLTEKAMGFIEQHAQEPFFLYLPYTLPHLSLQIPDSLRKLYEGVFEERPYYGKKGYAPQRYPLSAYAAMITYLDKQVGRIIETLKKYQIDENTLIMFSSDNGATFDVGGVDTQFFNSVAGLRGRKQDLYEGGIREPMLARWPGKIKPGQTTDHPSAQFDVMATLADLTGAKIPVKTDGISFLPTLLGKAQAKHPFLYFEFPEKSGQVAVRIGQFKGVKSNMKKNKLAPWELYDLSKDPSEQNDIAQTNPELIKKMDEIAKKQHRPSHVKDWEFVDPKF